MSYPHGDDHPYDDDPTPDLEDLQQLEPPPAAQVEVCGPVQTHALPSRVGVSRSHNVAGSPVPIAGQDLRRRRLLVVATGDDLYVGTKDDVAARAAAWWPQGVPLEILHTDQVYVMAATADTTAIVGVITEQWAD